jgi:hypothetical protein
MLTAPTDMSCAMIADWSLLQDAVSRHVSPEAWWLAQDRSCMVLRTGGEAAPAGAAEMAQLCRWLRNLPCPVLALASDAESSPMLGACDARTSRPDEAVLIARNVARSPLAALALVHVLRITEGQPAEHGLLVESLAYATLQAGPEFQKWRAAHESPAAAAPDDGPTVLIERDAEVLSILRPGRFRRHDRHCNGQRCRSLLQRGRRPARIRRAPGLRERAPHSQPA